MQNPVCNEHTNVQYVLVVASAVCYAHLRNRLFFLLGSMVTIRSVKVNAISRGHSGWLIGPAIVIGRRAHWPE